MDRYALVILPINHYLESWGDELPVAGFYSARQPVVRTIKGTRQAEDIFLWVLAHQKKPLGFCRLQKLSHATVATLMKFT